jgi:hypothetical protein
MKEEMLKISFHKAAQNSTKAPANINHAEHIDH